MNEVYSGGAPAEGDGLGLVAGGEFCVCGT